MKEIQIFKVTKDDIYLINCLKKQLELCYKNVFDKNDRISLLTHNIVVGVAKANIFFQNDKYIGMIYTLHNEKENEVVVNLLITGKNKYRKKIINFLEKKYEFINIIDSIELSKFYLKNGYSIIGGNDKAVIFTNVKGFEVKNYKLSIPSKSMNWALKQSVDSYQNPIY